MSGRLGNATWTSNTLIMNTGTAIGVGNTRLGISNGKGTIVDTEMQAEHPIIFSGEQVRAILDGRTWDELP